MSKASQILITGLNTGLHICATHADDSLLFLNWVAIHDYYTYGGNLGGIGWTMVTFRFRNSDAARTIYKSMTNITTTGPVNDSVPSGQSSKIGRAHV